MKIKLYLFIDYANFLRLLKFITNFYFIASEKIIPILLSKIIKYNILNTLRGLILYKNFNFKKNSIDIKWI